MADFELSIECARALHFAMILSGLRHSNVMEAEDYLGGLYLAVRDRLLVYWSDSGGFSRAIQGFQYLADAVATVDREGHQTFSGLGIPLGNESGMKGLSPDLHRAYRKAAELAAARVGVGKPVVQPEDFLFSLANELSTDVHQRLLESGIELGKLERVVKLPST